MKTKFNLLAIGPLVLLAAGVAYFHFTTPSVAVGEEEETVEQADARPQAPGQKARRKLPGKTKGKAALKRKAPLRKGSVAGKLKKAADRTDGEEDEENLSTAQKAVMKELQEALDGNDLAAVRRALRKFENAEMKTGDHGEVPVCMRARAVEALGWFGRDAALDLISYLGDRNDDVKQDALSQFEMALDDSDMGDLERSEIVKAAMRAITDPDVVDSLLNQLNNMRNSVKAETVSAILQTGSAQAQTVLTEQIDTYLDEGVKTAEDTKKWAEENPDDEDDNEMYGGANGSKGTGGTTSGTVAKP